MNREVRAACVDRAHGVCECGCMRPFGLFGATDELDHFAGRRNAPETAQTCWLLRRDCHRRKTESKPNAAFWVRAFYAHCERYEFTEQMEACLKRMDWLHARAASAH